MKKYILLFLVLLSFSSYAQVTINNYKYVIVPEKFSFLKENDQYRLNTLTTSFLQEKGFTVYYENTDLPDEIASNKCIALSVELLQKNTMFTTNLTLLLKDCKGNIIFKSKEGKSREKEYKLSYNLALRDAFSSLNDVPYTYNGPAVENKTQAVVVESKAQAVVENKVQPALENKVQAAVATTGNNIPLSQPPVKATVTESTQAVGTLYAQPTANGYQLIDTAPRIILTLYKTSAADYFIAAKGSSNGIVFKRDGNWIFEYYNHDELKAEKLLIKF